MLARYRLEVLRRYQPRYEHLFSCLDTRVFFETLKQTTVKDIVYFSRWAGKKKIRCNFDFIFDRNGIHALVVWFDERKKSVRVCTLYLSSFHLRHWSNMICCCLGNPYSVDGCFIAMKLNPVIFFVLKDLLLLFTVHPFHPTWRPVYRPCN